MFYDAVVRVLLVPANLLLCSCWGVSRVSHMVAKVIVTEK